MDVVVVGRVNFSEMPMGVAYFEKCIIISNWNCNLLLLLLYPAMGTRIYKPTGIGTNG